MFIINGQHDHDNSTKKRQIRGAERKECAEKIESEHCESANDWRLKQVNKDAKSAPSAEARKIKYEHRHKDFPTADWIRNLLFIRDALIGSHTNFVHEIKLSTPFSVQLHSDLQLKCVQSVPYERRIGHIDSTGRLVNIF